MKVSFIFFSVLVFGVVSSYGRTHEYNASTPFQTSMTGPCHYDEFFLVQQWPASYCRFFESKCRRRFRLNGGHIPAHFTVHGLWAQFKGECVLCNEGTCSNQPSCLETNSKTESNLKTYWPNLNGEDKQFWRRRSNRPPRTAFDFNMETYWPNLIGPDFVLWNHEYTKHASCISLFQNNRHTYFSRALNLAMDPKIGNVTNMLFNAGIQPGVKHYYRISDIWEAIVGAIKVSPMLECNYVKEEAVTTVQLFQIFLCFDNNAFTLKNCRYPYYHCPTGKWNGVISFPYP